MATRPPRCTISRRRRVRGYQNIQYALRKTGCGRQRCLTAGLGTNLGHVSGPSGFTHRKSSMSIQVMPLTSPKMARLVIPNFSGPNQLAIVGERHLLAPTPAPTLMMGSGTVRVQAVMPSGRPVRVVRFHCASVLENGRGNSGLFR